MVVYCFLPNVCFNKISTNSLLCVNSCLCCHFLSWSRIYVRQKKNNFCTNKIRKYWHSQAQNLSSNILLETEYRHFKYHHVTKMHIRNLTLNLKRNWKAAKLNKFYRYVNISFRIVLGLNHKCMGFSRKPAFPLPIVNSTHKRIQHAIE